MPGGRWRVQLCVGGKYVSFGTHETRGDAERVARGVIERREQDKLAGKRRTGERVGRWVVVEYVKGPRGERIKVRCDCGTEKELAPSSLGGRWSNSCGCARTELLVARSTKHGQRTTSEWRAWSRMKTRCTNPKAYAYRWYGAIGVTVNQEWAMDFSAFLRDVGTRPGAGYTLDRINPFGNYEPGNVRWATWAVQRTNKRHRHGSDK